jgi:hypothetical protein
MEKGTNRSIKTKGGRKRETEKVNKDRINKWRKKKTRKKEKN